MSFPVQEDKNIRAETLMESPFKTAAREGDTFLSLPSRRRTYRRVVPLLSIYKFHDAGWCLYDESTSERTSERVCMRNAQRCNEVNKNRQYAPPPLGRAFPSALLTFLAHPTHINAPTCKHVYIQYVYEEPTSMR